MFPRLFFEQTLAFPWAHTPLTPPCETSKWPRWAGERSDNRLGPEVCCRSHAEESLWPLEVESHGEGHFYYGPTSLCLSKTADLQDSAVGGLYILEVILASPNKPTQLHPNMIPCEREHPASSSGAGRARYLPPLSSRST